MTYDLASGALDDLGARIREQLEPAYRDFGLDVDLDRLVYGASPGGLAAFAPSRTLSSVTPEEVAAGTRLGLTLLAPRAGDEQPKLPGGVYALTEQFAADAPQGTSTLTSADGTVVASTPVEVGPAMAHPEAGQSPEDRMKVHVGDVTVTAGWLYICFSWDDPPGTPGGVCHQHCYGWH